MKPSKFITIDDDIRILKSAILAVIPLCPMPKTSILGYRPHSVRVMFSAGGEIREVDIECDGDRDQQLLIEQIINDLEESL